jgi:hypothetical protein
LDAEVDKRELLCSLISQSFVWLDDCHMLPLAAEVLGYDSLDPCLT